MVRFFVDAAPDLIAPPRMLPSSLLSFSICSLIAVARLSCQVIGSEARRAGLEDWLFVALIIFAVVLIGFGIIVAIVWLIGWLAAAWDRAF